MGLLEEFKALEKTLQTKKEELYKLKAELGQLNENMEKTKEKLQTYNLEPKDLGAFIKKEETELQEELDKIKTLLKGLEK